MFLERFLPLEDAVQLFDQSDWFELQKLQVWGYPFSLTDAELQISESSFKWNEIEFNENAGILYYPNETRPGMSGGPIICEVLDLESGKTFQKVIGVHIQVTYTHKYVL